jgi:hypothetical protein
MCGNFSGLGPRKNCVKARKEAEMNVIEPVPYADVDNPQTLNLYAYVTSRPLALVDTTGHDSQINLGGKVRMRVDTASADQVNIHIKVGNAKAIRGRLDPDTGQIVWTKGKPSNKIAERAQRWLVKYKKYDIAKAKKEMSYLGGTRGKEEKAAEEGLGDAASRAITIAMIADLASDAITRARVNSLEGTTGFHLDISGQMIVTNLQNYGDTFGTGATVQFNGDTFTLGKDGTWKDPFGNELTQNQNGHFAVIGQPI